MKLVTAVDLNWGIGKDNKLPWHSSEDLKHFKQVTLNQNIVMGRSTFESLPKILPNRKHIVLSRGSNNPQENVEFVSSIEELLDKYAADQLFVIGGRSIYEQLFPYCNTLYITYLYDTYECDTHFPSHLFKVEQWTIASDKCIVGGCVIEYSRKEEVN